MSHFCINCPRCHRGCNLCGRCACPPGSIEPKFFTLPIDVFTTTVTHVDEEDDMPQMPETD